MLDASRDCKLADNNFTCVKLRKDGCARRSRRMGNALVTVFSRSSIDVVNVSIVPEKERKRKKEGKKIGKEREGERSV